MKFPKIETPTYKWSYTDPELFEILQKNNDLIEQLTELIVSNSKLIAELKEELDNARRKN